MPMAERTVLPRSQLDVSRIGLGLAHVHLLERDVRRQLIERALDLGITHFDTSRFYGDGLSEQTLGAALGPRRKSLTIATKFGLLPTPLFGSLGRLAWPFRKARSLANKLGLVAYPRRSYALATMRRALQDSLRALRTDYIDIYHVHEPLADTVLADDLLDELQRAKRSGAIRLIGVSGAEIDPIVQRYGSALDVIQSAEASWSAQRWVPDITHSLFSDAARRSNTPLPRDAVRTLLQGALGRRSAGAVIVQTREPGRLAELVEMASAR
jgi:aryl-alcohol dehydrogenase-like predicted oxidoreductase